MSAMKLEPSAEVDEIGKMPTKSPESGKPVGTRTPVAEKKRR